MNTMGGRQLGRRLQIGIALLGSLTVAILWLVAWQYTRYDQQATERAYQEQLQSMARAVESHVAATITGIDALLVHLRQRYVADPNGFADWLRHLPIVHLMDITQIAVIGADGHLRYSSLGSVPRIDLSDRQHFQVHVDGKSDQLFISQPVLGRVSKKWSLQFTRRLTLPNGAFAGVMVLSVAPEQFSQYFQSLQIPEGSSVALVGRDRVVRARIANPPMPDPQIGKAVPGLLGFFNENGAPEGIKLLDGVFDGVPRLIAYRQVGRYPVMVGVSHSVSHIYKDFQQRQLLTYWLAAGISGILVFGCALLFWLVRQQMKTQSTLEESRQILSHQTDELARSNAELESFAYVASHDLREPLRMITSYLRLIERRMGDGLEQDIRDFIAFAVSGAERMDRLILDLLEYSRVGRSRSDAEAVPIQDILNQCTAIFQESLDHYGGTITLPTTDATVYGHRDELLRLFQNLIGNAIKYRHPDRPPLITISIQDHGSSLILAVHDNGIGIEPQYYDRIFVIFQRLHGRNTYEGTGIGLALCKKIVAQHDGRIWLTSCPGQSSTFFVELPTNRPSAVL